MRNSAQGGIPQCVAELVGSIDRVVDLEDVETIAESIKIDLQAQTRAGSIQLPSSFRTVGKDCYARRLVYRDPQSRYTIVAMTWGPQQATQLHDHAGIWCVESVIEGAIDVRQYELVEDLGERCRFEPRIQMRACVGDAGCLIPPFEYHVLSNAVEDRASITLHVYGGEMDHCNCYLPEPGGWWQRSARALGYDS